MPKKRWSFMKLSDHLSKSTRRQLENIKVNLPKKQKKRKSKKEEKVDWHDIMGMNRDTYKRKNGAIRRK